MAFHSYRGHVDSWRRAVHEQWMFVFLTDVGRGCRLKNGRYRPLLLSVLAAAYSLPSSILLLVVVGRGVSQHVVIRRRGG